MNGSKKLFTGLKIVGQDNAYLDRMTSRTVINLSLKSGKQPDRELAYGCLIEEISKEYIRHSNIMVP